MTEASIIYIIAIGIVALLLGLGAALFFRLKGSRSERDQRAKAMSRFLSRQALSGGSGGGETGGDDFGGDD